MRFYAYRNPKLVITYARYKMTKWKLLHLYLYYNTVIKSSLVFIGFGSDIVVGIKMFVLFASDAAFADLRGRDARDAIRDTYNNIVICSRLCVCGLNTSKNGETKGGLCEY